MSFKESMEKLGNFASAVASLGIEPKSVQPRLVEPMSWEEVHPFVMRGKFDRRDFVSGDDRQIYLKDSDENRRMITEKFGHLLSQTGASPIVRTITLKNGQVLIDLPLLVAQRTIATSPELRKQIPKLFGEKPTEKGDPDYLAMGAESQELIAKFALGQLPSLHKQDRYDKSGSFGGRIANVREDLGIVVGRKVDDARKKLDSSANKVWQEAPVVGRKFATSAGETFKSVKIEADELGGMVTMAAKRGIADGTAVVLTVESATEKTVGEVVDAAQVGALDLIAAAIAKGYVATLKKS